MAGGHEVIGASGSPERAVGLGRQGARGVVVDVFDREGLHEQLAAEHPEVVIGELSDLPRALAPSDVAQFDGNVRLRTTGGPTWSTPPGRPACGA